MKKIFILGLGAQKSGTTWISSQLDKCDSFQKGLRKEYHVLDKFNKITYPLPRAANAMHRQLAAMRISIDIYADHFNSLFHRNSNTSHVADITPSYCLCSEEILAESKIRLEARGFVLKIFFNMREPADRLWSQVKMKNSLHKLGLSEDEEIDYFLKFSQSKDALMRSDYASIIHKIYSVFDQQNVFIGFYENMFSEQSVENFAKFIDLNDFNNADIAEQIWVTKPNGQYDEKLFRAMEKVRKRYDYVLRDVRRMYQGSVPANWL